MKCPNCGKEDSWADASFCPRCGKQLIPIITNVSAVSDDKDDKKIRLQIYQISTWVFLTAAAFLYVSKVVPTFSMLSPWGELIAAVIVLIVSGIAASIVNYRLTNQYLPEKKI
jgi:uncharacterized membrane protein YvbJ